MSKQTLACKIRLYLPFSVEFAPRTYSRSLRFLHSNFFSNLHLTRVFGTSQATLRSVTFLSSLWRIDSYCRFSPSFSPGFSPSSLWSLRGTRLSDWLSIRLFCPRCSELAHYAHGSSQLTCLCAGGDVAHPTAIFSLSFAINSSPSLFFDNITSWSSFDFSYLV